MKNNKSDIVQPFES